MVNFKVNKKDFISVVSPVYGCSVSLYELYYRLKETLEKICGDFEIILVDDNSPDGAWERIVELSQKDQRVKGISLSRNFGQHHAITAGLNYARGQWVVIMDCDLQDQPEEIEKLYEKAKQGYDIVFAQRMKRKDHLVKKFISKIFYGIFNYFVNIKYDSTIANFGIYKDVTINEYLSHKETFKVFPISIRLIGFKSTAIDVMHAKRKDGKSSYNYRKLISLAIKIIVTQSNKPLYLSIYLGLITAFSSFLFGLILIVRYFVYNVPLGYTSIIVTILFTGGMIFLMLGLIGVYMGKIFDEVKERPGFIVREKTFLENDLGDSLRVPN
jgi:dolichol-phosphate mannosyltransferase